MSKVNIEKVPSPDDRKLPIFDEFREVTDRIRTRAFNLFARRGHGKGGDLDDWLTAEREICWPAAEFVEEDDEFEMKVALAGFEPEDITVTATPNEVIVKASRKKESKKDEDRDGTKVHWSEFQSNEVYRHFAMPADVDVDKIEAKFDKGMLKIEAPKRLGKPDKSKGKDIRISRVG
jgi:HSP20 family protein